MATTRKYKISSLLQQFFNEMERTVISKTDAPMWFESTLGLCSNLRDFLYSYNLRLDQFDEVRNEFKDLLKKEFNATVAPFNGPDEPSYFKEIETDTLYENKKRLAFIRKYSTNRPRKPMEAKTAPCTFLGAAEKAYELSLQHPGALIGYANPEVTNETLFEICLEYMTHKHTDLRTTEQVINYLLILAAVTGEI